MNILHLFQKLGKEIISQLKEQRKKGKPGPLKLHKVKKPKRGGDSDSDDDRKFSNITAQLAWERDIDLSKGQAFTKDPGLIENRNSKQAGIGNNMMGNGTVDKIPPFEEQTHIPNGNPSSGRVIRRVVKKPNGNPKSSPKIQKQFTINRVTPLPFYNQEDDPLEFPLDESGVNDSAVKDQGQTSHSTYSDLYSSMQSTCKSVDRGHDPFVVKTMDERFVTDISQVPVNDVSSDNKHDVEANPKSPKFSGADSKNIEQWVDEIIEGSREPSPSKSDTSGSPARHSAKSKKKKKKERRPKEEKERTEDKSSERSKSKERKSKKRNKTPTSEEFLISDSDVDESVV